MSSAERSGELPRNYPAGIKDAKAGANFEYMPKLFPKFLPQITRERLDELAPENPVRVKNSWVDGLVNTRALEEVAHKDRKFFRAYRAIHGWRMPGIVAVELGRAIICRSARVPA